MCENTLKSFLALVKIVAASQRKRQRKNLCQDLLIIENTDSDLKVHALHYANELLMYTSDFPLKNFCKLAKQTEALRNYQKQGLVMIKHCLGNSQINSIPE